MKLCNIQVNGETHLALLRDDNTAADLTAAGFGFSMDEVISGVGAAELRSFASRTLPTVNSPVFADILNRAGKLVCVGLNYRSHAQGVNMKLPEQPILFSKFADALVPANTPVALPEWEESYDYEAELVIVIGREAWNVSAAQAPQYIFGYTCGNDFSCRDAQMRSGQWLIGKTMPGFGPCGPCIVTADAFDPDAGKSIRSYVNGQLRQDGSSSDMIFSCAEIVSYASRYIRLCPGDLIFTGTPSGVALEEGADRRRWLRPGDRVDVVIEGIGTLTNSLV